MVKSNFFKKYSKPLALLAILIILIIVLFSCVNNYSVENFTPKNNAKIEVMLWTDVSGSLNNPFVNTEWLDLVTKYEKYATFEYGGGLTDYIKYAKGITMANGVKIATTEKPKDDDFKWLTTYLPFVTMVIEIDKVKDFIGMFGGNLLTVESIKLVLFSAINKHYRKLYTNAHKSTQASAAPAASAASAAPAAPAASAPWM